MNSWLSYLLTVHATFHVTFELYVTFHDACSVHTLRFFHYTSLFTVMFAFRTYCIDNTFRVRSTSRSLFFDTNELDLDTPFSHPLWRNSWYGVAILIDFTVDNTMLFIQHRSRRILYLRPMNHVNCVASDQIQNIYMLRENKSISFCKNKCKSQRNQNRTFHTTTLSLSTTSDGFVRPWYPTAKPKNIIYYRDVRRSRKPLTFSSLPKKYQLNNKSPPH